MPSGGADVRSHRRALGRLGLRARTSSHPGDKLLDLYGDHVFAAAVADIDGRKLADVGALAIACEHRRKDKKRPGASATIITTNLAFKQWGTTFPGAACFVALVDRFA